MQRLQEICISGLLVRAEADLKTASLSFFLLLLFLFIFAFLLTNKEAMESRTCHVPPLLFPRSWAGHESIKGSNNLQPQAKMEAGPTGGSCGWAGNFLLMAELRIRITSFRDMLDLSPCNGSIPMNELLMRTVEDIQMLYPKTVSCSPMSDIIPISLFQGLRYFYEALKSVGDSLAETHKLCNKFRNIEDIEDLNLEQLGELVLERLSYMNTEAKEMFDLMYEEDQKNACTVENSLDSTFEDSLKDSHSMDKAPCYESPQTPTSVLPMTTLSSLYNGEFANMSYSPPLLMSLKLQSLGKLRPIDVKRLSFHIYPHVSIKKSSENQFKESLDVSKNEDYETKSNSKTSPIDVQITSGNSMMQIDEATEDPVSNDDTSKTDGDDIDTKPAKSCELPPTPPPTPIFLAKESPFTSLEPSSPTFLPTQSALLSSPPPLPPKQCAQPPPPSTMSLPNGPAPLPSPQLKGLAPPPPPPPLGAAQALRPKSTKLKRSSQMGSMYRLLKGKVEGSNLSGKSSQGKRVQIGVSGDGKGQGMADALAEMAKRSPYFKQIEEDVQNHASSIMQMKSAINSFRTKDMSELRKFHQYVELHLKDLSDESQVLARFDEFPTKKLETIRTAATLYSRLDAIANNLESWKIEGPLARQIEKVECYFNKIKVEVDAIERSKDEESKRFLAHKIEFDFSVLTRIKEFMVDVSSNCIEMSLKESKEVRADAERGSSGTKHKNRLKALSQILWKAFQLAFRVYNFAGGQDDRADGLTRKLAQEIEIYANHY